MLLQYKRNYKWVINFLKIPKQNLKDQTKTVNNIFKIVINFNKFMTSIFPNKIAKVIPITITILVQNYIILREV